MKPRLHTMILTIVHTQAVCTLKILQIGNFSIQSLKSLITATWKMTQFQNSLCIILKTSISHQHFQFCLFLPILLMSLVNMAVKEAQVQGEFYLEQRRYSQFMHLTYLVIYGHETGCIMSGWEKIADWKDSLGANHLHLNNGHNRSVQPISCLLFLEMWAQDTCDLTIMNCQTNSSMLIWYLESIKNMLFSLSFIACTHLGLGVRFKTCFKAMHYVLHAYSFKRSVSCPILCKWLAIWKQIHLWWPW